MQGKWSRILLRVIIGVLVMMIFVFLMVTRQSRVSETTAPISGFVASVDRVVSLPFRTGRQLVTNVKNLLATYEENAQLKQTLQTLDNQSQTLTNLEEENQALRSALSIKEKEKTANFLTGQVLVRSTVSWLDELVLDLGSQAGVTEGMLALTDKGVVGQVIQVSGQSSRVQLLTSPKQEQNLPVKWRQQDKTIYGIFSHYDQDKGVFVIKDINTEGNLDSQGTVETSGLDGETRANLTVGQITGVDNQKREVYVQSLADFNQLSWLVLVRR